MTTTQQNDKGNGIAIIPPRGTTAVERFGEKSTALSAETANTAAAAQARATIEASYVMALQRPRIIEQTRVDLLEDCSRTRFADRAIFAVPRGKKKDENGNWVDNIVEGFSIRFAEAAVRCMTNIAVDTTAIYDDLDKRIVRVSVTDLQANVTYRHDVTIEKTVERKKAGEGVQVLRSRANSYGDTVYIVAATDDEMLNKQAALVSKAMRQLALRHIPGDILEDCWDRIQKTLSEDQAKNPAEGRKKVIDSFASIGVKPDALAQYLGHPLDSASPAEIANLRSVFTAVKEGHATWHELLAERATPAPAATVPAPSSAREKVAQKAAATRQAMKPATSEQDQAEAVLGREPGSDG